MTARRLPWLTALLLGACCVLAAIAPLSDASGAQRTHGLFWTLVLSADASPAPWRWLSAHLLHTDPMHLFWNALALLVLGTLIERSPGGRPQLLVGTLAGALAVALWFHTLADSRYYCGLSGVLNALFVLALDTLDRTTPATTARRRLRVVLGALLIGAFARAGYDLWLGAPALTGQQWPTATGAHLAGLLAGVLPVLARRGGLTGR